jgi:hypothetical protein
MKVRTVEARRAPRIELSDPTVQQLRHEVAQHPLDRAREVTHTSMNSAPPKTKPTLCGTPERG